MTKSLFITLEGIEGVGKSTQCKMLSEKLHQQNVNNIVTREPGGTKFGEYIRDLILNNDQPLNIKTQLLLHMSARSEHIAQVIIPNLKNGNTVISDRFCDSSFAYQASDEISAVDIIKLHEIAFDNFLPDISFFLDLDPEVAYRRMCLRNAPADRYERMGLDFQYHVYKSFQSLCKNYPERIIAIDASQTPEKISCNIMSHISEKMHNIRL